MELYDEDDLKREQKQTKLPLILKIFIVILTIFMIIIIALIIYLKSTIIKITLDGQNFRALEKMMVVEGEEIYIPIKQIASYLNYEAYAGDYINKSEDKTKCYITSEFETVQFMLDSNIIIIIKEDGNEKLEINKNVIQINNELYTTVDGIKKAFNVEFSYNIEQRYIQIYTMDYLAEYFGGALENIGEYSEEFENKKAIFNNLIIMERERKYGIVKASTGDFILEAKYDDIEYLSSTSEFLIKSNNKYGVISISESYDVTTKVKTVYDELKLIDSENNLYLAKSNGFYGVINNQGKVIIPLEYNTIGIQNYSSFAKNGIESKYIILDELIPVKKSERWGFFNISGDKVTECKYSGVGCTTSKVENTYPAIVVPSYKLVVVKEEKAYNLIGIDGEEKLPSNVMETIYLENNVTTGENTFYMAGNNDHGETKRANIEKYFREGKLEE